jgi:hypothetical protein
VAEQVLAEAMAVSNASAADRLRTQRRLRGDLRRIRCRDYVPPLERDAAMAAVEALSRGPIRDEPGAVSESLAR